MNAPFAKDRAAEALKLAARLAIAERWEYRPLDPSASGKPASDGFDVPLPRHGRDYTDVLLALNEAATPGISGTTRAGFMSWVIGGSHPAGVAADWMASAWGQNACLHDCSPASAQAEAASAGWLLDLLDLPREASVGFATGATMAAFTCLAAARLAVLERAGHDFEKSGLFGCPPVAIYIADDAHVTNFSVLRYLGFGNDQIRRIPSASNGTFDLDALERRMCQDETEARIVIGQAGHIMTGAFDDFVRLSAICKEYRAWVHVDGAFGLWVRASERMRIFAHGIEFADSWSVDGHKWLQIPYDLGFAIVRDERYHRRAMSMQAGYLPEPSGRRNNSDYVPELSRRARGFSAWTVMQCLGRLGIAELVERHCNAAHLLSRELRSIDGIVVVNEVHLNQLALAFTSEGVDYSERMASRLNATGRYFVRTAKWRGRDVLRISIICGDTTPDDVAALAFDIRGAWETIRRIGA